MSRSDNGLIIETQKQSDEDYVHSDWEEDSDNEDEDTEEDTESADEIEDEHEEIEDNNVKRQGVKSHNAKSAI